MCVFFFWGGGGRWGAGKVSLGVQFWTQWVVCRTLPEGCRSSFLFVFFFGHLGVPDLAPNRISIAPICPKGAAVGRPGMPRGLRMGAQSMKKDTQGHTYHDRYGLGALMKPKGL